MSNSYRKTPIMGISGGYVCQKNFKKQEHRRERSAVRSLLKCGKELPSPKKFGNEWDSPRDGKQWLSGPDKHKWMRK